MIIDKIKNKETAIAILGLGYVGLPLALALAKFVKVIGFDIKPERIELLKKGIDPSKEIQHSEFVNKDIKFSHNIEDLKVASFFIIAVPTPIDSYNQPDLTALLRASSIVGKVLKKGDYVVFESTVFPGCTEEKCIPIIEKESGLTFIEDFKVGYSPERINPGDKEHTLTNVTKVVSGCDEESLSQIAALYEMVVEAGVYRASSIKVAEATKVIENTQRDLNIALMNELSMIFDRIGINTHEVIEAASTKWNFLKFTPGLVGGHCIGVDPYYLTYKSTNLGHNPKVILSGREINDSMGVYVARKTIRLMTNNLIDIPKARALVMGVTFKENVSDIRNSKVVDVIRELREFNVQVDIIDPHAESSEFEHEYKYKLSSSPTGVYDAIILAVGHNVYKKLENSFFQKHTHEKSVFIDIKGLYKHNKQGLTYWSL
jgi:UDP-N-acetyl-D-galactosamine dehydrogenase